MDIELKNEFENIFYTCFPNEKSGGKLYLICYTFFLMQLSFALVEEMNTLKLKNERNYKK